MRDSYRQLATVSQRLSRSPEDSRFVEQFETRHDQAALAFVLEAFMMQ
jgi:hypothetical protein